MHKTMKLLLKYIKKYRQYNKLYNKINTKIEIAIITRNYKLAERYYRKLMRLETIWRG